MTDYPTTADIYAAYRRVQPHAAPRNRLSTLFRRLTGRTG